MVFSSLVFLCIFLPTVFLLYTLVPSLKFRNGLLIVASLIFYAYGEPVYVLLMIFSSLLNYICARLVANENAKRKLVLVLAVVINLGILAVFKYSGFFVESLNSVTGLAIPVPQIDLPIGISFFTFQALSYVIDVYRKTVDAQKNYLYVLLYITFSRSLLPVLLLNIGTSVSRLLTESRLPKRLQMVCAVLSADLQRKFSLQTQWDRQRTLFSMQVTIIFPL